jgi:pilus assembly protein Flp/PilA
MNRRKTMDKIRKSSQGRWRLHLLQLCLAVTLSIAGAMIYLVLTNVWFGAKIMLLGMYQPEDSNRKAREAMMPRILNFIRDNTGTTAIEYALMASLIAVAIAASVGLVGQAVESFFARVVDNWPS